MGTLICCALPSLLVLLGLGTTVAAVVSAAPWLVVMSRHKAWLFLTAGVLILGSRWYVRHVSPKVMIDGTVCPVPLTRATRLAWWMSVVILAAGVFVAYVLGPLLGWIDR